MGQDFVSRGGFAAGGEGRITSAASDRAFSARKSAARMQSEVAGGLRLTLPSRAAPELFR